MNIFRRICEIFVKRSDKMNVFGQAVNFIFDREGRTFENVAEDPGGGTKYGISHKSYPALNIKDLTEDEAATIYLRDYWNPLECDKYAPKVALALFDTAVNQGDGLAQQILGELAADGYALTVEAYLFKRLRHYVNLIEQKPELGKFCIDWLLRVVKVYEFKFT
jgi:hypothetical protein